MFAYEMKYYCRPINTCEFLNVENDVHNDQDTLNPDTSECDCILIYPDLKVENVDLSEF